MATLICSTLVTMEGTRDRLTAGAVVGLLSVLFLAVALFGVLVLGRALGSAFGARGLAAVGLMVITVGAAATTAMARSRVRGTPRRPAP